MSVSQQACDLFYLPNGLLVHFPSIEVWESCLSGVSTMHVFVYTDHIVCTGCCGTLDHIVTFFFKNLSKKSKGSVPLSPTQHSTFLRLLKLHSDMFQQMLASIMNVIMFENCRCQWSMSRPLLGLILLNEEVREGGGGKGVPLSRQFRS